MRATFDSFSPRVAYVICPLGAIQPSPFSELAKSLGWVYEILSRVISPQGNSAARISRDQRLYTQWLHETCTPGPLKAGPRQVSMPKSGMGDYDWNSTLNIRHFGGSSMDYLRISQKGRDVFYEALIEGQATRPGQPCMGMLTRDIS